MIFKSGDLIIVLPTVKLHSTTREFYQSGWATTEETAALVVYSDKIDIDYEKYDIVWVLVNNRFGWVWSSYGFVREIKH